MNKGIFQRLVGSLRFSVLIGTIIGLVANDIFQLGVSDTVVQSIAGAAVAFIVGDSLRKAG